MYDQDKKYIIYIRVCGEKYKKIKLKYHTKRESYFHKLFLGVVYGTMDSSYSISTIRRILSVRAQW